MELLLVNIHLRGGSTIKKYSDRLITNQSFDALCFKHDLIFDCDCPIGDHHEILRVDQRLMMRIGICYVIANVYRNESENFIFKVRTL